MNTHAVETFVSENPQNLIDSMTAILARAGHPCPQSWIPSLSPEVMESQNNPHYQRYLINRYWRNLLGNFEVATGVNTKEARFNIVDEGTNAQWLHLFEIGVVPCIIANNLPITQN